MQVIVAACSSSDTATRVLDELKQGKKAGLVGLVDVAAIVKDADGKLRVTNARPEPTREGLRHAWSSCAAKAAITSISTRISAST
jgi:hypothetical protein